MSKMTITDSILTDIADSIRGKLGVETTYRPGDMPDAIDSIPSEMGAKNIVLNGTYTASDDNLDGYSSVIVSVPNTYAQSDEGKVVSQGALVAQTSRNVAQNGTYDTTLNNEIVVNVSGGGSGVTLVSPEYQGFSYGFVSGTTFTGYQSISCYLNFYLVTSGKKYILVAQENGMNRQRASFFPGKAYDDFSGYVHNGHSQVVVVEGGVQIVNSDSSASTNAPVGFTAPSDGIIVYQTNNASGEFPCYCFDLSGLE